MREQSHDAQFATTLTALVQALTTPQDDPGAALAPGYALLHRADRPEVIQMLVGDPQTLDTVADLPLDRLDPTRIGDDLLVALPYRQICERGYAHHDDRAPLRALRVRHRVDLAVAEAIHALPDVPIALDDAGFDISDSDYADIVRRVISEEIGRGEGSNFVIRRSFVATVRDHTPQTALAMFNRLLRHESGAYWTFVVHFGDLTLVGATPEMHVRHENGIATMNPISGTYRYPGEGPSVAGVLAFLGDRKESDELYMVVDEELKMLGRVCADGARVHGPHLKEMARVAHTEYLLTGETDIEVSDLLRETLLAPTVTGSPLENACAVIARHEPRGRRYYGGVLALIGQCDGRRTVDSAIIIRTADIDAEGHLEFGVGATLVRHSDPHSEVQETAAKAAGFLDAIAAGRPAPARTPLPVPSRLALHPEVRRALAARNRRLARFWLEPDTDVSHLVAELVGREVLVVDAEDTFTAMLAIQLRALGPVVTVHRFDEEWKTEAYDLVVVGPGPGDPRDLHDPKIAKLHQLTSTLLDDGTAFVSVCLGHQVLATILGLPVVRRAAPAQGEQRRIDYFGRSELVGFYNTFAARSEADDLFSERAAGFVEVCRDAATSEVHALRAARFASAQFHPESVLTRNGPAILAGMVVPLLAKQTAP